MPNNPQFIVAPMMDWTDKHCRYFHRLISKKTKLYTEMISTDALLYGDRKRLLDYHQSEHPIVLQVGGSDPKKLAQAAKIAKDWGYDEVNINVGCPSNRVQSGSFGAVLFKTPEVVAAAVEAMIETVDIPVSVKTRIGVDEVESFDDLAGFVETVSAKGCRSFTIHARKAWLNGLSPKQNRTIPPLNYAGVYDLKSNFTDLDISINGGIDNLDDALNHLEKVDGVMLGRAAYHQPYLLGDVDNRIYGASKKTKTREQILLDFIDYMAVQNQQGVPIRAMTKHILGLYKGEPNAKKFRRLLSGNTVEIRHLHQWLEGNNG